MLGVIPSGLYSDNGISSLCVNISFLNFLCLQPISSSHEGGAERGYLSDTKGQ